jgi:hypothetical protein
MVSCGVLFAGGECIGLCVVRGAYLVSVWCEWCAVCVVCAWMVRHTRHGRTLVPTAAARSPHGVGTLSLWSLTLHCGEHR